MEEIAMRLSPPKKTTWWLALLLGLAGLAPQFVTVPVLSSIDLWLIAAGWLLLVLGTLLPGL